MRKWLFIFVLLVALGSAAYVCINYYGYVFAKTVRGEIIGVERVTENTMILPGRQVDPVQLFSFAVAIRSIDGEIYTASSEDRQWAIARRGQCAEAKYYPYPPWDFEKSGTYRGARLIKLYDCPGSSVSPAANPVATPELTPSPTPTPVATLAPTPAPATTLPGKAGKKKK